MLGSIHQLLPAMAGVMGVATVWADTGYLARTGPVPLRFMDSPVPIVKQVGAPFPPPFLAPFFPPPVPISLPTPPLPSRPPDTSNVTNDADLLVAATNGPALEFDAREFVSDPGSATAPEPLVSPQMLLKYFTTLTNASANASANANTNASTNAASSVMSSGMVAPLGFTPPSVTIVMPTPPLPPTPPPVGKGPRSTTH
jgi:hypothetical protein